MSGILKPNPFFICSPLATNRGSLNKDPGYNGSIASSVTSPLLVNSLISCSSTINVTSDDTDENKYKRRSALTWFARYVLYVLWCQPIKLIQVVPTSEFHEY